MVSTVSVIIHNFPPYLLSISRSISNKALPPFISHLDVKAARISHKIVNFYTELSFLYSIISSSSALPSIKLQTIRHSKSAIDHRVNILFGTADEILDNQSVEGHIIMAKKSVTHTLTPLVLSTWSSNKYQQYIAFFICWGLFIALHRISYLFSFNNQYSYTKTRATKECEDFLFAALVCELGNCSHRFSPLAHPRYSTGK